MLVRTGVRIGGDMSNDHIERLQKAAIDKGQRIQELTLGCLPGLHLLHCVEPSISTSPSELPPAVPAWQWQYVSDVSRKSGGRWSQRTSAHVESGDRWDKQKTLAGIESGDRRAIGMIWSRLLL